MEERLQGGGFEHHKHGVPSAAEEQPHWPMGERDSSIGMISSPFVVRSSMRLGEEGEKGIKK